MSPRVRFVAWITPLATLFGGAVAAWRLGGQGDLIADVAKIVAILFVATAVVGFLVWTILHRSGRGWLRGALAGAVVGALIVPLPFFAWTLKTELWAGGLSALWPGLAAALDAGLYTFEEMTRASIAAILGSAGLGAVISSRPDRARAGTSPRPH
ncbi:MAG: hypothetical protein WBF53_16275 [Litorimonas sp.]